MRTVAAILIAIGLVGIPVFASAQQAGEARSGSAGGNTKVKETTRYDFSGDDVTGNLVKPSGSNIQGEQHGKTSSLIDIRSDFIPEMLKTVEDL